MTYSDFYLSAPSLAAARADLTALDQGFVRNGAFVAAGADFAIDTDMPPDSGGRMLVNIRAKGSAAEALSAADFMNGTRIEAPATPRRVWA